MNENNETKQQHTPGPWHVEAIDAYDGEPIIFGVCHPKTTCNASTVCNVFSAADAHLIAEAGTAKHETGLTPRQLAEQRAEMLAALQAIIAADNRGELHRDHLDTDEIFDAARAVIAKATGETL